jgi:hypothetical protein
LIGFGRLDDARVQRAIDWQARAITGEDVERWYASGTSGPGFACAANEGLPCAWGAIKALRGLGRIPIERRTPIVSRAIETGVAFLLARDPLDADYPAGWGNTRPNGSWFRLGFPSAYVTDVLENLEIRGPGHARIPSARAIGWLLKQDDRPLENEYAQPQDGSISSTRTTELQTGACRFLRAALN